MPQAMKIPDAKARSGQGRETARDKIPARDLGNVKSKKEVILEAQRDKNKVQLDTLMDICHQKKRS